MKARRTILLLALVATVIGCDRVTKHVAVSSLEGKATQSFLGDTVRLEYAENPGAFLSLGADLSPAVRGVVFTIGPGIVLIAMIIAAIKLRWAGWQLLGASLAFAGGASNLVDRVVRGSVVDFLNIGVGSLRTGIFNVADVAVMVGVCILAFTLNKPENGS